MLGIEYQSTVYHGVSMPKQLELQTLVVRPIQPHEKPLWNQLMSTHHYLGFRKLVDKSIKYVAELQNQWVALLGWGSAAFKCSSRDEWIGWWAKEQQWTRLVFIANNLRFLILPDVRIPNLDSKILSVNLKRMSLIGRSYTVIPLYWLKLLLITPVLLERVIVRQVGLV